jgi:hypothetical protein
MNFGWPLRNSDYVNDRLRQHLANFPTVSEFSIRRDTSTAARNFAEGVYTSDSEIETRPKFLVRNETEDS